MLMIAENSLYLEKSWEEGLKLIFSSEIFVQLQDFLLQESLQQKSIYPKHWDIFRALNCLPLFQVKVVILGQDPYHSPCLAEGLSFSVPDTQSTPPSLQNIFKELLMDHGLISDYKEYVDQRSHLSNSLSSWASQGVLLLNSVLTVEKGKPGSHAKKGWEYVTDEVIRLISTTQKGVVFLLWGEYAKKKSDLIDQKSHCILSTTHPSPFSARKGFFGCQHFTKANTFLKSVHREPINWLSIYHL